VGLIGQISSKRSTSCLDSILEQETGSPFLLVAMLQRSVSGRYCDVFREPSTLMPARDRSSRSRSLSLSSRLLFPQTGSSMHCRKLLEQHGILRSHLICPFFRM
jgi:hypothetical protein